MSYWFFFENKWHRNYFIRRYFLKTFIAAITWLVFLCNFLIPKKFYALKRPIFIIGCSRSGTTLFINCFKRHPDICDWSEAAQIWSLDFYDQDIDHYLTSKDLKPYDVFRLCFLFGAKTRLTGKKRFCNKHPENSMRIEYIKTIFPDAIFIHMIRDGRAVTASNYRKTIEDPFRRSWPFGQFPKPPKWKNYLFMPLEVQFAHQWVDTITHIREVAERLLSTHEYYEIRYEEFCKNPKDVLNKIDEFCLLDSKKRDVQDYPDNFTIRNDKWKKTFNESQIKRINNILHPLCQQLGYFDNDKRKLDES